MSIINLNKLLRINRHTRNGQSPSFWHKISLHLNLNAPKEAGVYVLYHDNKVVYVGQTKNFKSRFIQHKTNLLLFHNRKLMPMERFYFKYRISFNRQALEKKLINRLEPAWNIRDNPIMKRQPTPLMSMVHVL